MDYHRALGTSVNTVSKQHTQSNMNKRIKELAEEAEIRFKKLYIPDTTYVHESPAEVTRERLQKFAELLVKEMCGMMEQTEDDLYAMDPSERPTEYIEWLYYWRTRFEKHFGVK
jgi:hypothetical protein